MELPCLMSALIPSFFELVRLPNSNPMSRYWKCLPRRVRTLPGVSPKNFKHLLAGSIVVGVENDAAGAAPFGAAQARYVNNIGFRIFIRPFGDGGQRRRRPPLSVAFSNRLFAASRQNGPAGTAHCRRVGGEAWRITVNVEF